MSDDVTASVQKVLDDFHLKNEHVSKLTSVYDDLDSLVQLIHRGQNFITLNSNDREELNQSDKVDEMDKNIRTLVDLEANLKNTKTAITTIATRIGREERVKNITTPYDAEINRLENEYNKKSEEEKYLTNNRYITYRQHIWSVNNPDEEMPPLTADDNADDDIVMGRTKLSFKCPITTSWLESPMTSKLCKHSYSKAAISQLLNSHNGAVMCPLSGCNKIVRMNILFYDEILADKVKRAKDKAEEESVPTDFYDVE